jgi:dTDP-4-amino-4,6-dideoxygalactose transaminase
MDVPLCEMYLDQEIKKAALKVLDSGRYINGPEAKAFEKEFADYVGMKYGISVNSGTSALFITFMYLNLQPGDEVIVPSHTFIASASQAIHLGAKPVFVDVDPDNYTMDIRDVKRKITDKTKAIVAVHIYGHPVDMDPLLEIAEKNDIIIVEDCAQSHGSKYKGKMTGSLGDFSCFSFFPSKIMNVGGDGGMILTNDAEAAEKLQMLKNHGRKKKYEHQIFGMNMRMPEIPAAIGRVQLKKIHQFIHTRKNIAQRYNEAFQPMPQIKIQNIEIWANPVYYIYVIRVKNRDKLQSYLKKHSIHTGIHYPIPLHQQPIIKKIYGEQKLPNTEKICQEILSLPFSAAMSNEQVSYVIKHIKQFYAKK